MITSYFTLFILTFLYSLNCVVVQALQHADSLHIGARSIVILSYQYLLTHLMCDLRESALMCDLQETHLMCDFQESALMCELQGAHLICDLQEAHLMCYLQEAHVMCDL